jgi:hypothetical protein
MLTTRPPSMRPWRPPGFKIYAPRGAVVPCGVPLRSSCQHWPGSLRTTGLFLVPTINLEATYEKKASPFGKAPINPGSVREAGYAVIAPPQKSVEHRRNQCPTESILWKFRQCKDVNVALLWTTSGAPGLTGWTFPRKEEAHEPALAGSPRTPRRTPDNRGMDICCPSAGGQGLAAGSQSQGSAASGLNSLGLVAALARRREARPF